MWKFLDQKSNTLVLSVPLPVFWHRTVFWKENFLKVIRKWLFFVGGIPGFEVAEDRTLESLQKTSWDFTSALEDVTPIEIPPSKFGLLHLSSSIATIIIWLTKQILLPYMLLLRAVLWNSCPEKILIKHFFKNVHGGVFLIKSNDVLLKTFARKNNYSENTQDKTMCRENSFLVMLSEILRFLLIRFPLFLLHPPC